MFMCIDLGLDKCLFGVTTFLSYRLFFKTNFLIFEGFEHLHNSSNSVGWFKISSWIKYGVTGCKKLCPRKMKERLQESIDLSFLIPAICYWGRV